VTGLFAQLRRWSPAPTAISLQRCIDPYCIVGVGALLGGVSTNSDLTSLLLCVAVPPFSPHSAGFPRIGAKRQMKFALEKYWSGKLSQAELLDVAHGTQANDWQLQADAGISRVGVDGSLYDQVLDATFMLGLAPVRFAGSAGLDQYFAMARGAPGVPAMDMSKFFDTNYHYLVSPCSSCLLLSWFYSTLRPALPWHSSDPLPTCPPCNPCLSRAGA
jgi:hypothetical protein